MRTCTCICRALPTAHLNRPPRPVPVRSLSRLYTGKGTFSPDAFCPMPLCLQILSDSILKETQSGRTTLLTSLHLSSKPLWLSHGPVSVVEQAAPIFRAGRPLGDHLVHLHTHCTDGNREPRGVGQLGNGPQSSSVTSRDDKELAHECPQACTPNLLPGIIRLPASYPQGTASL